MLNRNKVAVISTGNGGQSMAAYLSLKGYETTLYAREKERVEMFRNNVFELGGKFPGTVTISMISMDMEAVIRDAALIMVTTPAQYHSIVARAMAPYLVDGQSVVLNPGRTFGTCEFENTLERSGCRAKIILGETDTFLFTCRADAPGHPIIYEMKQDVGMAAHNPKETPHLVELVSGFFPDVVPAKNVLQTGMSNIGMIFHPLPTLMNVTRIERHETYLHYIEGITPSVAAMLEQMDAERVAVAEHVGARVLTAKEWVKDRYGSEGATLYERIQNTEAYRGITAPKTLTTRYFYEDIQTGCVPVSVLGDHCGIDTPLIDAVISMGSAVCGQDFRKTGRNESMVERNQVLKILQCE